MNTFKTMLKVELKLSLRGMDMVIFAVLLPIVMTVIFGMVYGDKPAYAGAPYSFFEQSFGAISTISICAGGIMGLPLLVSDYRHRKILKRFKVTPVSPGMILAVQVVIYTLYAVVSLITVYGVARGFFGYQMEGNIIEFLGSYLFVMLAMFSIGIMVGGIAPNLKTASIAASVLYFPMLIFSGATLPYEVMPRALQAISNVMPLTQGIKLLKSSSLGLPLENAMLPFLVLAVLTVVCIGTALKYFKWE